MRRPEILVIGCFLGFVAAYLVGAAIDDALGHDGRSLVIAEIVTTLVMALFAVPSIILAMRSGKR